LENKDGGRQREAKEKEMKKKKKKKKKGKIDRLFKHTQIF
jgi:hypothetical protein